MLECVSRPSQILLHSDMHPMVVVVRRGSATLHAWACDAVRGVGAGASGDKNDDKLQEFVQELVDEAVLMQHLSHTHIVTLYGISMHADDDMPMIVMEFMPLGELKVPSRVPHPVPLRGRTTGRGRGLRWFVRTDSMGCTTAAVAYSNELPMSDCNQSCTTSCGTFHGMYTAWAAATRCPRCML